MSWNYRLIHPDGHIDVYPLPDAASPDDYARRGRIITELNQRHKVPQGWNESGLGWDVAVIEGDLHPSVVVRATVHGAKDVPSGDL